MFLYLSGEACERLLEPENGFSQEYRHQSDHPQVIDELPVKNALGRIASRRNAARRRINKQT